MFITACMLGILTFAVWRWHPLLAGLVTGIFLLIDAAYFASNLTKIPDGGWFPLVVAATVFTLLTTWATGRRLMRERLHEDAIPWPLFVASTRRSVKRVSGTAVFLTSTPGDIPPSLLHNLKHNRVLHERVVLLNAAVEQVPHVRPDKRLEVEPL